MISRRRFVVRSGQEKTETHYTEMLFLGSVVMELFKVCFMLDSNSPHCYFLIFFNLHTVKPMKSPSSSSLSTKSSFLCYLFIMKYMHFVSDFF